MRLPLLTLGLIAALASPALAADDGARPKDAPDPQAAAADEDAPPSLTWIEGLMRDVERRLADCDAGAWTQEEQQRLADALGRGHDAVRALDKLIEAIEARGGD